MSPIVNSLSVNTNSPIVNRTIANSDEVDCLLEDCSDLIDVRYKKWFAARFYQMQPERVMNCAAAARVDGKNAQRLFTHLVKKGMR